MICYSVDNMNSFENVETKWVPEIRSYDENAPIFMLWYVFAPFLRSRTPIHRYKCMLSTKIDLREDREAMAHLREDGGEVTKAQGKQRWVMDPTFAYFGRNRPGKGGRAWHPVCGV